MMCRSSFARCAAGQRSSEITTGLNQPAGTKLVAIRAERRISVGDYGRDSSRIAERASHASRMSLLNRFNSAAEHSLEGSDI